MNKKEIVRKLFDVKLQIKMTRDPYELEKLNKKESEIISQLKECIFLEITNDEMVSNNVKFNSIERGR